MAKKKFTVTIINNQTLAFDIYAKNEQEAREIAEEKSFDELVSNHENRTINAEYFIDEITKN
jgi:hypothetical protein